MNIQTDNRPTAAIYTLGCKVNQYESEAISERLEQYGFVIVPFSAQADVSIINTCTVTAESDRKACQIIRRAAARNPEGYILVTGCMAQAQPERAAAIPHVDYVCGSRNKLSCADVARTLMDTRPPKGDARISVSPVDDRTMEPMCITRSGGERTRAYVKIEDGCENRCTYCAIRGARGAVTSKRPEDVLSELRTLAENGYREVVLTGIETASYGVDFRGDKALDGYRLIDLLEEADHIPGIERIRLGSLEPTYMKPETVSRMAALSHLAPHFHLSLQSGCDSVLHAMKRKYNMKQIRAILEDIRDKIPSVQFTTDIMTGFPGESLQDFAETLSFAREARFLHIHVFPYSRRKNTPAGDFPDQIPTEEKNRRAGVLIAAQAEITASLYEALANTLSTAEVLPEAYKNGIVTAHTASFAEVHIAASAPLPHKICQVRITDAAPAYLTAELV